MSLTLRDIAEAATHGGLAAYQVGEALRHLAGGRGLDDLITAPVAAPETQLRDEFAMHAMQSFIARWAGHDSYNEHGSTFARVAGHSYEMADAMLKARSA